MITVDSQIQTQAPTWSRLCPAFPPAVNKKFVFLSSYETPNVEKRTAEPQNNPPQADMSKCGFASLRAFNKIDRMPYFDIRPRQGVVRYLLFYRLNKTKVSLSIGPAVFLAGG